MDKQLVEQLYRDVGWARCWVRQAAGLEQDWYRPERAKAELEAALEKLEHATTLLLDYRAS